MALNSTIELQWVEVLKLLLYNIVVLKVHVTTEFLKNIFVCCEVHKMCVLNLKNITTTTINGI